MLNVSERSVRTAKTVLEHGAQELMAAVEAGEVAVSAAAAIAELPKDEQAATVVDFVAAKAKVCGGGNRVVVCNAFFCAIVRPHHLATILRRVVFLSQPHFSAGTDRKGVGLRAVVTLAGSTLLLP